MAQIALQFADRPLFGPLAENTLSAEKQNVIVNHKP